MAAITIWTLPRPPPEARSSASMALRALRTRGREPRRAPASQLRDQGMSARLGQLSGEAPGDPPLERTRAPPPELQLTQRPQFLNGPKIYLQAREKGEGCAGSELIKDPEGEECPKLKPWDLAGDSSWR